MFTYRTIERALGITTLLASLAGCNQILGNSDHPEAADATTEASTGGEDAGASDAPADSTVDATGRDGGDAGDAGQLLDGGPCAAGLSLCGSECLSLQSNVNACGSCGNSCVDNLASQHVDPTSIGCQAGKCVYTCAAGFGDCVAGGGDAGDAGDAGGDASVVCATELSTAVNCGACQATCDGGSLCAQGDAGASPYACVSACPTGTTECGTSCANLQTSSANCGKCGSQCSTSTTGATATCTNGSCIVTCLTAGDVACSGTCINPNTDLNNCGQCGKVCTTAVDGGVPACSGGVCGATCTTSGYQVCGTACTNPNTDVKNCGSCGNVCTTTITGATPTCSGGVCGSTCPNGGKACNGACVNTQTDSSNCGACGNTCTTNVTGATSSCSAGTCTPACTTASNKICGTSCVDTTSNVSNCGSCGNDCSPSASGGVVSCVGGSCSTTCSTSGFQICGTSCVNAQTDSSNCGKCGTVCSTTVTGATSSCASGTCTPSCNTAGFTICGSTCVNEASDLNNCGACSHACTTNVTGAIATCSSGTCGASCTTTGNQICGTKCVNESTDLNNCGACSHACTTSVTGAVATCSGGTCGASCTTTGFKICGSACTNPQTDNNNCGACNTVCSGGEVCTAGTCVCPNGTSLCGGTTCVSLSSATNCGRCGNSCGGGTCTGGTTCAPWRVYAEPNTSLSIGGPGDMGFDGTYVAFIEDQRASPATMSVVNIFGGTPTLFEPGTSGSASQVAVVNGTVYWTNQSFDSTGTVETLNTISSPASALSKKTVVNESTSGFPSFDYEGLAVDSAGQTIYNIEIVSNKYFITVTPSGGGITSNENGDQTTNYNAGIIYTMGVTAGAPPGSGYLFYVVSNAVGSNVGLEEFNLNTGANDVLLPLTAVQNSGGPMYIVSDGTFVYYFEASVNPQAPTIVRVAQGQPVTTEPSAFYSPGLQAVPISGNADSIAYDSGNIYFAHSQATTSLAYIDYVPTGSGNVAAGTASRLYTAPSGIRINSVRAANGYVVWTQLNTSTSAQEIWAIRHP